jgi:hypothetical protein
MLMMIVVMIVVPVVPMMVVFMVVPVMVIVTGFGKCRSGGKGTQRKKRRYKHLHSLLLKRPAVGPDRNMILPTT